MATRVLGIDDSPTQAERLQLILEEGGYEVEIARNGEEGLGVLSKRKFDLLITDVVMPGMDGFELCRRVKANALQGGIPVILLTTLSDPSDIIRGLECGADNFLNKPYEANYLLTRVATLLENRRLRASNLSLGAEILFRGKRFVINAEREQILDLLISTFEDAVLKNSELQERERDLALAHERLEERNQSLLQRGQELTNKNLALERATQAKSDFLAGMSHELRTPLNAIIGFSELLAEETAGPLAPLQKEYVGLVVGAGKHLLSLINDVLDLSKIEAGRIEIRRESSDWRALVQAVRETVSPLAAKKRIELTTEVADDVPTMQLDPMRVKQILYNLLSNAIKFTPEAGRVSLEVRFSADRVAVSVEDSGPGIDAEDLPRLFQVFEQLEAGRSKPEGTGLGLALTRQLVELHGGEIHVESEAGKGSRFWFSIPLAGKRSPAPTPMRPVQSERAVGPRPQVLIIEDDPAAAELIAAELREAGYGITISDQHHALEKAESLDLYAITLDLLMPGVEGFAILGRLKRSRLARRVPVVVVSVVDEGAQARLLGAADALVKPVPKGKLIEAIEGARRAAGLTPLPRILMLGADPTPYLQALAPLAGACQVFPMRRLEPGVFVFKHTPPDLAIAISNGPAIRDEIMTALSAPPLANTPVIFVGERTAAPQSLLARMTEVVEPPEAEAKLASVVQATLAGRLGPAANLPDRGALIARIEEIAARTRGDLAGVVLLGVRLPVTTPISPQRLEKQLRRRDFVAWLPPNRYVMVAADVQTEDLPGLRQRFVDAICQAAGCEISESGVDVVFASGGVTPQELVQSFIPGGG
ncbi:MAG: response regulator [Myxococcales bacterium]|nr:response regulator [Myxococcales bacterium]